MESSRLFEQLNHLIHKLPQKKLSKGLAFFLVLYLAYLLSTIVWQLVPVEDSRGSISYPEFSNNNSSSANSKVDVSELLSLNLFGKVDKKVIKKEPVADVPKSAPKTKGSKRTKK